MSTTKALGFKLTTIENWLNPDPLVEALVNLDVRTGGCLPVDGKVWIAFINALRPNANVPIEIYGAFHFVVGAIGYAYFYYLLFTVVSQQVFRVADFTTDKLFESLGKKPVRCLRAA